MSSYKLYLHFEGSQNLPDFTYIYKTDRKSQHTVGQLIHYFCSAYHCKRGQDLHSLDVQLISHKGKAPRAEDFVIKAFDSGSDVQVTSRRLASPAANDASYQDDQIPKAAQPLDELAADLQLASGVPHVAQYASGKVPAADSSLGSRNELLSSEDKQVYLPIIKQFLDRAKEAESKKYFRAACKIYEQVLKVAPLHKEALTAFAQLWLTVSRPQDAVGVARRAADSAPQDPCAHRLYAQCLSECKQYQEALAAYNQALDLAKQRGDSIAVQDDMQVDIVRVLYHMGGVHRDAAATLIMNVLRSNDHHQSALIVYAKMASERAMIRDAVQVLIRVLIRAPDDQEIRLALAKCLQKPEGMAALRAELDTGGETDAAMAFLATAIKDHGAVPASNMLLRRALELKPSNPSYALNLMHGMELNQEYAKALHLALHFCQATQIEVGEVLQVNAVVQQLQGLPCMTNEAPLAWLQLEPWRPQWTPHCSWQPPSGVSHTSPISSSGIASTQALSPAGFDAPGGGTAATAVATHSAAAGPAATSVATHSAAAQTAASHHYGNSSEDSPSDIQKVDYDPTQLDFLALLFTVVKLLYIGGALPRCARVVQLLNKASAASAQKLHKTLIRNEAAYFGCVKQLVLQHPPPPHPLPQAQPPLPLYLCGDSHCLSGAWNLVQVRGECRVLVPRLVTGLKIWHMREAGIFYPKHSFLTTCANLPDAAQVIFMFGEIDCREGLTMAVDKLKYETVDAAMDVLLNIYQDVLLDLVQRRRFEMFVHPVAPVLNETRHVVAPFNRKLQQKIEALSQTPEACGRLHWLNFFPDLLTADGTSLNPTLQFDGTHMSPYYVHFLNKQLSRIV